jgi:hypothetical protein
MDEEIGKGMTISLSQSGSELALASQRKLDYLESFRAVEVVFARFVNDSYIPFGVTGLGRKRLIYPAKLQRCFVAFRALAFKIIAVRITCAARVDGTGSNR